MCTVAFRSDPDAGVLHLLSVRDEFLDRPTRSIGRWWPDIAPNTLGAQDLVAGGTNLALDFAENQVWIVVNGPEELSAGPVRSRGSLPLDGVQGRLPEAPQLTNMPGFHFLQARAQKVTMWSWDGRKLTSRQVGPGNHVLTYAGLDASDHQRGHATAGALGSAVLESQPGSWEAVLAKAWVRPCSLNSRRYGSVGATVVHLGPHTTTGWSLQVDGAWRPIMKGVD